MTPNAASRISLGLKRSSTGILRYRSKEGLKLTIDDFSQSYEPIRNNCGCITDTAFCD
jgi:hypothetical protein